MLIKPTKLIMVNVTKNVLLQTSCFLLKLNYICMVLKSYKYRLYPNKEQSELINKHIGACRFVYNLALEVKNYAYMNQRKSISCFELMKDLPSLKKECEWLKEVDSQALQQSIINLDKAFTQFFKHGAKFPKFKKKSTSTQSFRSPHPKGIRLENNKIFLPKFKTGIKIVRERDFAGEIRSATVSKTPTGKYFVSILVDNKKDLPNKKIVESSTSVGIDLGISSFIITSDGQKIDNPKYLRNSINRLKVLQRRLRNKKKGSANKKKAYKKIALIHEKVANQRKDFLHKLSTQLIKNHDTLCMEYLNISGMVKNHNLALSISDAGWGMFVEFCKYKAEWNGNNILHIPTFEPSTKVCSCCGSINKTLTLANREWICANCGIEHDRDINAAKVIKQYCLTKYSPDAIGGEPVELLTLVGAMKQEGIL